MEANIYIYGVIDSWQDSSSSEWGYVNLKNVKEQYEAQKDATEIKVHIHSEGGVVTEGFAIHDYLRSLGKPVTTFIEGSCASIATVIALAGDKRVMTSNANFFVHNPWGYAGGDKSEIQKYADELDRLEEQIADFYASKTNITKQQALEYMKAETTFTPEEALEKGFITEVQAVMRAVALYKPENKSNSNTMAELSTQDKSFLQKGFDAIMNAIKGDKKNIVLQDANGIEIEFPEIEKGQKIAKGAKAQIEGKAADGEYVMPQGETYVFESGELTEVKEAEEQEDELQALKDENEAQAIEIQDLKAKLEASNTKYVEIEKQVNEFKAQVTSKFDLTGKKEKEEETPPTNKRTLLKQE